MTIKFIVHGNDGGVAAMSFYCKDIVEFYQILEMVGVCGEVKNIY